MGVVLPARSQLQEYFAADKTAKIQPRAYAFAGSIFAKFPDDNDSAIKYLQIAVQKDTVKDDQKKFLIAAGKIAAASGNYGMQLDILRRTEAINGGKLSELEYYNLSKAITDAKTADTVSAFDSSKYLLADSVIQAYIAAYPEKSQGYSFRVRFAKMSDADTSRGLAVIPIEQQNQFLKTDTAADSNKSIFINDYYLLIYYAQYATDLPKEDEYRKAIAVTEEMKTLYHDTTADEYKFADKTSKQNQDTL